MSKHTPDPTRLLCETSPNGITTITLNSPKSRNALDAELCADLVCELEKCETAAATRVVILRAEGKAFSAGGDIKAMRDRRGMFAGDALELARSYRNTIQKVPLALLALSKPIVAVIQGSAIGAGFDLACMCDLRLATPRASFAESFATLGLISGFGGAHVLTRLVGWGRASDLALTGRRVSAEEALQMGLISRLCGEEEIETVLTVTCEQLLKQSPPALAYTKRLLRQAWHQSLDDHLFAASTLQGELQVRPDHIERVERLLQK